VDDRLGHLLPAHGDFEPDAAGAVVKAIDVLLQAEDLAGVDADALEDAVAVEQAVVVDADLGVGLVVELAVDPDARRTRSLRRGLRSCGGRCRGHDDRVLSASREWFLPRRSGVPPPCPRPTAPPGRSPRRVPGYGSP